jgi:HK97 family phage major capsid protein
MTERIRLRLSAIRRAVQETAWYIQEGKLEAMLEALELHAAGGTFTREELQARAGDKAKPIGRVEGAIAVLPLFGVLSQRMGLMSEMSGGTSTERFARNFDQLMADESIGAIVIQVDSPGGNVAGTPEVAKKIYDARGKGKAIIAQADSLMASAAYYIGAAADEIVATPSAEVGSIGVYAVHEDRSAMNEAEGLKYTIIKAGKYKAEGNPFGPLSDDALAAAQEKIDQYYGMFVRDVATFRGVSVAEVRNGYGEGRALIAKQALAAGMIDRVATLEETLQRLGGKKPQLATRNRASATDQSNTTTAIADRGAAAPDEPPASPQQPAPKAKEHTVENENTAAPGNGAESNTRESILAAERARVNEIQGLCRDHKCEHLARGFVDSGATVDAASREILRVKGAEAAAQPQVRVGESRETRRPWAHMGDFSLAVVQAFTPNAGVVDPRLAPLAAASGMQQQVPSEGGFLVPPQFSQAIWDEFNQQPDNLLAMTDNYTVTGESLTFNANAETSRATGSRYGGIKGYWINEADQATKSKPKFRQARIEPQQMVVLVYLTDKLLRNSGVALGQYVTRAAGDEVNFLTGDAIFRGTGAGQPQGFTLGNAMITVNKETSQPAATIQQENISKMWARLHPRARAGAVWLGNADIEPQLDSLNTVVKNVAGTENVGGYANKVWDAEKRTLKGRPLINVEYCETLGTKNDLVLANLGYYVTGTRGGIETAVSMHVRFEFAEQALRFIFEVDGQPWHDSPITPYKGSNTLSAFVNLQTR